MRMQHEVTGEGAPVVLVPGGLTGWLSWVPHAEQLSATRKVVRVQLLSVQLGLEGRPLPADYSPRTEVQALGETLDALELPRPVDFVAWSYGGLVTLDFVLDHPEWVRTLTLIEPPAHWALPSIDADERRVLDQDLRLSRDDITEDHLELFLHSAGLAPPGSDPRALPQWPTWVQHRQSLRANPSIMEYQADRGRLAGFAPPVLLVKGTGSVPLLHRIVDELGRQLPHAEVAEWPGGHAPQIVSMGPFLERLAQFQASAGVASTGA